MHLCLFDAEYADNVPDPSYQLAHLPNTVAAIEIVAAQPTNEPRSAPMSHFREHLRLLGPQYAAHSPGSWD